jgi:hypothetical protein
MQKSFSEFTSLAPDELSAFIEQLKEPLLITNQGRPQFIAQTLTDFEDMVRRLRTLECEKHKNEVGRKAVTAGAMGKVIPFRR